MSLKALVIAGTAARQSSRGSAAFTFATQQIANRPLVSHVIDAVRAAGADEIAVVGQADALDRIRFGCSATLDVDYISAPNSAGLFGQLAAASTFVNGDPCIVHLGEGLAGRPLPAAIGGSAGDSPDVAIFVHHARKARYPVPKRVEELLGIAQLSNGRGALDFAGVGLLGPGVLSDRMAPALREQNGDSDLAILGEIVAEAGGRLSVGELPSWRQYTGDPRDLLELNRMVLDDLEPSCEVQESDGNRFEGRLEIHPSVYVSGSVIHGPVIIGEGAEIIDAYIGPYTTIGRGVHIEGAEIERSIVYDGATIQHLGVRVEDSTVGPHARIVREFGLPRAMRVHVGEGVELTLD